MRQTALLNVILRMLTGRAWASCRCPPWVTRVARSRSVAAVVHDCAVTGKRKVLVWMLLLLIGGAVITGLGVFMAAAGLDDADKWASVLGLFVALAGLGLSGYGLVVARRQRQGQTVADSIGRGGVTQVRGVRGNLRIGTPPAASTGLQPSSSAPPLQAPTSAGEGDQSVVRTWTAGPVRQVDDVGGDTDIDQ